MVLSLSPGDLFMHISGSGVRQRWALGRDAELPDPAPRVCATSVAVSAL